jgi:hypothetical protein
MRGRRISFPTPAPNATRPRSARTVLEDLDALADVGRMPIASEAARAHGVLERAIVAGDVDGVRAAMLEGERVLQLVNEGS